MKIFNVDLLDLPSLNRIDGNMRFYETPDGKRYPSVTTILSRTANKDFLVKWQNRIGIEEAEKIKKRSAVRGTAVHKLCEKLVLNEEIDTRKEMPFNVNLFNQIKRVLVDRVDNIRASEATLYSHSLKMAGSVDLVADYNGRPAIIDYKTSMKTKRSEWIDDYRLQATAYSVMLYEMTGLIFPNLVIIICIEQENEAQVFEARAADWIPLLKQRVKLFHETVALTT